MNIQHTEEETLYGDNYNTQQAAIYRLKNACMHLIDYSEQKLTIINQTDLIHALRILRRCQRQIIVDLKVKEVEDKLDGKEYPTTASAFQFGSGTIWSSPISGTTGSYCFPVSNVTVSVKSKP